MTYIVKDECIRCKFMDCVEVCPVDCFYEVQDPRMLVIDPDTCIDCGLCVDECPVQAIFPEEDLPEEWHKYIQINADWFEENG